MSCDYIGYHNHIFPSLVDDILSIIIFEHRYIYIKYLNVKQNKNLFYIRFV